MVAQKLAVMMPTSLPHPLTFNRVTLHLPRATNPPQQAHWRWQVNHALGRIACHPTLPPQAILVVRHLPDPLPNALLSDRPFHSLHPWEQQLQAQINDCWRTAIRVAHTSVPPTANAVWFADSAEWLACLSWDWHQGVAAQRWWWQTWRPSSVTSYSEALFRLWQREAQWLPPTLILLGQGHGSGLQSLLARFSRPQAQALHQEIAQAYQLPTLGAEERWQSLASALPTTAPWQHLALSVDHQALVALCLAIAGVPQAWQRLQAPENQDAEANDSTTAEPPSLPSTRGTADVEPGRPPAIALDSPEDAPLEPDPRRSAITGSLPEVGASPQARIVSIQSGAEEPGVEPASPAAVPSPGVEAAAHELAPAQDSQPPYSNPAPIDEGNPVARSQPHLPSSEDERQPQPAPEEVDSANNPSESLTLAAEQGIPTHLGGIWYLVNVLADLDWLVDNTNLEGWHKLQALAQALLPAIAPDTVWPVLASLAIAAAEPTDLEQWVGQAMPAVHHYLIRQLALVDSPTPEAALAPLIPEILQASATLYVTRTHIDLVFSLEQIRLDVRVAGLDRNPGWVPILGRVITFHYH